MHTQPGFVSDGKNLTPEDVARIARSPRDPASGSAERTVTVRAS